MARRSFSRDSAGTFRVRLRRPERELLAAISTQLVSALDTEEPTEQPLSPRLFPVAYPDDPIAERDYRELMGAELVRSHREALEVLVATVDKDSLEEDQLRQWLKALEVLRLVLGTWLDVSQDDPPLSAFDAVDPRSVQRAAYDYLGGVQDDVVNALSSLLPREGREQ
ncbi:MAG TPA: DUF2017 family protein [Acidimicrobiales bacterium]|nr:DUF2017 family protein [Acidimicrobiales bacterium]